MKVLFGFLLAALSVTGFAATFVFGGALTKRCDVAPEVLSFLRFAMAMGVAFLGEGVTALQWLGTAFIIGSAVIETRG